MRAPTELKYWRAKFKDMKVAVHGKTEVLHCELEIELRSTPSHPWLYYAYWAPTSRPLDSRVRTLFQAKERVRSLFIEQLTEWQRVDPVSSLASPDTT